MRLQSGSARAAAPAGRLLGLVVILLVVILPL
jgi:hypothetical protein